MSEKEKTNTFVILGKDDTLTLKGVAILLLLSHHLFFQNAGLYYDIQLWENHYLLQEIGIMSKVCVSIFVFLSGYGLAVSAEKTGGIPNLKNFYTHRFKKIFLNYWLIWLIFVPISYFYFGMTFEKVYQHHVELQLATDIFGIHEIFFGPLTYCYNPTWWFYSCIIVLYILFPLLYKWACVDIISVLLTTTAVSFIPAPHTDFIRFYILTFVLGIMFAVKNIPPPLLKCPWYTLAIVVLLMAERNLTKYPILTDCLICIALVQLYRNFILYKPIKQTLIFFGRHSMNIFLFHTFWLIWLGDYIYILHNPVMIFLMLLALCIPISVMLEWVKKYTLYKMF